MDSKPQTVTLEWNLSESNGQSKSINHSPPPAESKDLNDLDQDKQPTNGSESPKTQIQPKSPPNEQRTSLESKDAGEEISAIPMKSQDSSKVQKSEKRTESRKTKQQRKIPISIQLYSNLMRWAFAIFTCIVLKYAYPIYLVLTKNCQKYRNIHGDVTCPISAELLFSTELIDLVGDHKEFELYLYLENQYMASFCLLLMIILAIWAQVKQKMILERYKHSVKISDFSVILVNLPEEVDEDQVRKFCFEKYKENQKPKKRKKRGKEENLIFEDLVIEEVVLANYDIGMESRTQRIKSTKERVKQLKNLLKSEKSRQALKPIKKLLNKYQTLLKIYKDELEALQKSISRELRRSNKIAILTLKTQKMASDLIKSTKTSFLIVRILKRLLSKLGFCTNTSPRFIKAVEPGELNWNSIGYSRGARLKSRRKTNCCMFIVLLILSYYYILVYLLLRMNSIVTIPDEKPILSKIVGNYLPTVLSVIITNLSSKALERFEKKEIYLKKKHYFYKKVSRLIIIQIYSWFLITIMDIAIIAMTEEPDDLVPLFLYAAIKYTLVKCVLEPVLSVVDFSYFYKIFKGKKVKKKLKLAGKEKERATKGGEVDRKGRRKKRSASIYEFMPPSVIDRITEKPELCLEKKYSKLISILLIDYIAVEVTLFSPFLSIIFMILQYLADRWLLLKRFKISEAGAGLVSRNAVRLLVVFPKIYIFQIFFNYLDGTISQYDFGSIFRYALDLAFVPFLFLPFPWVAEVVYNRWFRLKGGDGEKEYGEVCHLFEVDYRMKKTMAMSDQQE